MSGDVLFGRIPRRSVRTAIEELDLFRLGTFENATYELVELRGGQTYPPHTHLRSNAKLHIVFGQGEIVLNGRGRAFATGHTFEVPRATSHGFRVDEDTLMLSIQHPPIVDFDSGAIDVVYGEHLVEQRHERYSAADHAVWREALARTRRLAARYGRWMHPAYLDGLARLDLPDHVPRIEAINERLEPTGWHAVCVDGYIPSALYVELIASGIFPVSRTIRRAEHIDHAPSPDLIHDVLGHSPMLFSAEHRDFMQRLAVAMRRAAPSELEDELYEANRAMSARKADASSSPAALRAADERVRRARQALATGACELTHLRRMYLWTVEFGLLGQPDAFWIYGAGILSAGAELRSLCEGAARHAPYSLEVIDREIEFCELQPQYYLASDFAQLDEVLAAYQRRQEA